MNVNELPQYKCHKIVRAAKITGVEPGGLAVIVDMGKVSASIEVPEGWVAKHDPLQGDGYVVAYDDGYLSWSPAAAFEAGYHRIPELGIACGSTADAAPANTGFLWRKKPVVIEAHQWFRNGDHPLDYSKDHEGLENGEMRTFSGAERAANGLEGDIVRYYRHPDVDGATAYQHCGGVMHDHGWIDTLEGGHIVCPGDWIITGVKGEVYPCKPDIFAATYEPADAPIIDLNAADFSDALMWLKEGRRVARAGWNGKNQFVVLVKPGFYDVGCSTGAKAGALQPFLALKNAQDMFQPGWIPSMGDLMATDWQVMRDNVITAPSYKYRSEDGSITALVIVENALPHQVRVIDEYNDLDNRLVKLTSFFDTDTYRSLDVDERGRLKEQSLMMGEYLRILAERIKAFC